MHASNRQVELRYDLRVMTAPRPHANVNKNTRRWPRAVVLLLIYGALLAGGRWGGEWLIGFVGADAGPGVRSNLRHLVMAGIALYTVLMAIPFVPGMEISLALLAAFGHQVAVFIYLATLLALAISYLLGRLVPLRAILSLFGFLHLRSAHGLVRRLEPLSSEERLQALIANAPSRFVPWLLKHRYIAIAVALNLPGNALIGGGGGIALLAGLSGIFAFPRFLAAVSLAILPVPLGVVLMGL